MRMLPSSVLFAMIVIGGAVAVFANALYPLAKAREAKYRLASDARTILLPEVKRNADLGLSMQGSLAEGKLILPLQKFDVTAWETISKGGLLLGLEPAEIVNFLHVYRLAYEANDLCVQIVASTLGVNAALQNADQTRQLYIEKLRGTLNELQAAFHELDRVLPQKS
jgi:hypothetical protein